ncbi:MAG: hypothetical protein JWM90_3070 [Thermoleophilia bacterium]|nr:hypothetical protein [Thermoleophilia bacterium]
MTDISPGYVAAHAAVGGVVGGGLMLAATKLGPGARLVTAVGASPTSLLARGPILGSTTGRMVAMGAIAGLAAASVTEAMHQKRGPQLSNIGMGMLAGGAAGAAAVGVLSEGVTRGRVGIGGLAGAGIGALGILGGSFIVPLVLGEPTPD